jgi:hypothetical protein
LPLLCALAAIDRGGGRHRPRPTKMRPVDSLFKNQPGSSEIIMIWRADFQSLMT